MLFITFTNNKQESTHISNIDNLTYFLYVIKKYKYKVKVYNRGIKLMEF